MKTLINALTNTYRAVQLLQDPAVSAYLQSQLKKKAPEEKIEAPSTFGLKNAFYHKHYIVHVVG